MNMRSKVLKEHEIEKYFQWVVATIGGNTYKFKSPNKRGVSDQIACLPDGQTWFVELKRPKGGVVAPLQEVFEQDMKKLHQKYARLTTREAINEWIAKAMNR